MQRQLTLDSINDVDRQLNLDAYLAEDKASHMTRQEAMLKLGMTSNQSFATLIKDYQASGTLIMNGPGTTATTTTTTTTAAAAAAATAPDRLAAGPAHLPGGPARRQLGRAAAARSGRAQGRPVDSADLTAVQREQQHAGECGGWKGRVSRGEVGGEEYVHVTIPTMQNTSGVEQERKGVRTPVVALMSTCRSIVNYINQYKLLHYVVQPPPHTRSRNLQTEILHVRLPIALQWQVVRQVVCAHSGEYAAVVPVALLWHMRQTRQHSTDWAGAVTGTSSCPDAICETHSLETCDQPTQVVGYSIQA